MELQERYIVIGESSWKASNDRLLCIKNPTAVDLTFSSGELIVVHNFEAFRVLGIIWRLQFWCLNMRERSLLEIIKYSGIPCVNSAECLLAASDRLAAANLLKDADLPVLPMDISIGKFAIIRYAPTFPKVIKVGSHHGGFGKALIRDESSWGDAADLAAAAETYVCMEPFVDYVRDLRYLLVGDQVFVIERHPSCWKANVSPKSTSSPSVDSKLLNMANRVRDVLNAQVVGVDFIQDQDGKWWILEANLEPGLDHAPKDIYEKIINLLE